MNFGTIENIPRWAVCGFVNGDWSGVSDEDEKLAKEYEADLNKKGWIILDPIEGSENDFCPYPAFGLACDTMDMHIMKKGLK